MQSILENVSFNSHNIPEDCSWSHSNKEKIEAKGRLSNLPDSLKKIAEQWSILKYYLNPSPKFINHNALLP